MALAFAVGHTASAQSLIQALASTYNSNPDLLAQRAVLRQTDETLAQAVANWRPRVSLSLEYNKIEADSLPVLSSNRYLILNGRTSVLSITQPLFRG
ncbi:MAG: TolC family protein, partial [Proteobacteria bacterium]|nr:TolC family protein [Pseudomonadota bacterium]